MTSYRYRPQQIMIDEDVAQAELTQEICHRFSEVPQQVVSKYSWKDHKDFFDPQRHPLSQGKKILHLKRFSGNPLKRCPGVTDGALCCNYLTLDFVENCGFECTYCILQAFLSKPVITAHVNVEEILEHVRKHVLQSPNRLFRVGTGEYSDSLVFDELLGINQRLIPFFAQLPNALLELKTKSNSVDHLLDLPHGGKTIFSWSINPEAIVNQEEHKTARLTERFEAAQKVIDAGYRVAFHIDPMIYYPGWENGYCELVDQLFDTIPAESIMWVSIGSLRYLPKLKRVVEERFPDNRIFTGEFVPAEDGKMRYLKPLREKMFATVQKKLQERAPKVPNYLCMEKPSVWKKSMPHLPANDDALEEHIATRASCGM